MTPTERAAQEAREIVSQSDAIPLFLTQHELDNLIDSITAALLPKYELMEACEPIGEIAKLLNPSLKDDYTNTMSWAVPDVGTIRRISSTLQKIGGGR